jgi:hypothetical protein
VRGNSHARFLGGRSLVTLTFYPTDGGSEPGEGRGVALALSLRRLPPGVSRWQPGEECAGMDDKSVVRIRITKSHWQGWEGPAEIERRGSEQWAYPLEEKKGKYRRITRMGAFLVRPRDDWAGQCFILEG